MAVIGNETIQMRVFAGAGQTAAVSGSLENLPALDVTVVMMLASLSLPGDAKPEFGYAARGSFVGWQSADDSGEADPDWPEAMFAPKATRIDFGGFCAQADARWTIVAEFTE